MALVNFITLQTEKDLFLTILRKIMFYIPQVCLNMLEYLLSAEFRCLRIIC